METKTIIMLAWLFCWNYLRAGNREGKNEQILIYSQVKKFMNTGTGLFYTDVYSSLRTTGTERSDTARHWGHPRCCLRGPAFRSSQVPLVLNIPNLIYTQTVPGIGGVDSKFVPTGLFGQDKNWHQIQSRHDLLARIQIPMINFCFVYAGF
jgi:hypothetical protein